ncbi:MAG TPA: M23 family metallopeptidase [Symbiobacteriaceae bacterium]
MKPTRGLSKMWLSNLPRERRNALFALTLLLGTLGSLVLYQRYLIGTRPPQAQIADQQSGAAVAGGSGEVASPGTATGTGAAAMGPEAPPAALAPTRLLVPLSGSPRVLQPFAEGYSAVYQDFRTHPGIDFAAMTAEQVLAAADGNVLTVEDDPLGGKILTLDNGGPMRTRYAGLGRLLVAQGAQVKAGQPLAEVGAPSPAEAAMGPHLHFEVYVGDTAVNPASYFPPQ